MRRRSLQSLSGWSAPRWKRSGSYLRHSTWAAGARRRALPDCTRGHLIRFVISSVAHNTHAHVAHAQRERMRVGCACTHTRTHARVRRTQSLVKLRTHTGMLHTELIMSAAPRSTHTANVIRTCAAPIPTTRARKRARGRAKRANTRLLPAILLRRLVNKHYHAHCRGRAGTGRLLNWAASS